MWISGQTKLEDNFSDLANKLFLKTVEGKRNMVYSDNLFFAVLYAQLKRYNRTEDSSQIIHGIVSDIYLVEEHRELLATIATKLKKESSLLSSIYASKWNLLTDEDVQVFLDYYEDKKIPTVLPEVNLEPLYDFFDVSDIKEKNVLRWATALGKLNSQECMKNTYYAFCVKEYFELSNFIINTVFYNEDSIFKKDALERKDSAWSLRPEFLSVIENNPNYTIEDIGKLFYSSDLTTNLRIEQFSHLKKDIEYVEKIIGKSLEEKLKGTNIIFWGMPGTGKTELAILLAKLNDWKIVSVSESDKEKGKEKTRAQRIQALVSAQKIFAGKEKTVLLFDEAEDLFKMDISANHSKLFINRITENSTVPIIWTTNSLYSLGQPFLRRMSYNVEFEFPDSKTRGAIWDEYLNIKDEGILQSLAREYKLTPAAIKVVSDAVNISDVKEYDEIKRIINKTQKLLNYGKEVNIKKYIDHNNSYYDITAANASLNLERMKDQLSKANSNFSICLYGPSGTGKSEYVKYLANQLGYQVLYKRASELLGMYVGETEKNIAELFREGTDEGKFILIDEGDTFLRDRSGAHRSWEVSQVNEFLSHMEMLQTPLAITTNLFESMDAAALRRFTFKVKFDFLTLEQRTNLFKKYFSMEAPEYIKKMEILTPGDFANVKRKIDILNITEEKEILSLLEEEIKQKPQFVAESNFGFITKK